MFHPRPTLIGTYILLAIVFAVYSTKNVVCQDQANANLDLVAQMEEAPSLNPSSTPALRFGKSNWFQDESGSAFIWVVRTEPRYIGELRGVEFTTVNGTAVGGGTCGPGIDYILQENVPLVMQYEYQQINLYIQLCPDNLPEPPETVMLVLWSQNSSSPTIAQLTISDAPLRFTISGRVLTSDGRPIRGVRMHISDGRTTLTSSFGCYFFDNIVPAEPYQVAVLTPRHTLTPGATWLSVTGDVGDLNFVANPEN